MRVWQYGAMVACALAPLNLWAQATQETLPPPAATPSAQESSAASSSSSNATPSADRPAEPAAPAASEAAPNPLYTTKKLPFMTATPGAATAAPAAGGGGSAANTPAAGGNAGKEGASGKPAPVPFGKSTAAVDRGYVAGPAPTRAVPVENIDAIESSEPAVAVEEKDIANPAKEDPAEPTELTAPIFNEKTAQGSRGTMLRVLNKVTARAVKVEVKPDQTVNVGKLIVSAAHCQHSDASSLPDDAALISLSEASTVGTPAKPLFSGWMYRSSPSINAVESPIYDVSLVGCTDAPSANKQVAEAKPPAKDSKKR